MELSQPELVFLFSGKRKSGKDYITDYLHKKLGNEFCTVLKISEPIKSHWAKVKNLNLEQLLSDGAYKEQYRLEMIKWSEEQRRKDYGIFCRLACQNAKVTKVWIVSDIRRKSDLKWFKENYCNKVKTVKIFAMEEVRKQRGFVFISGIDDAESECNLDDVPDWDFTIDNSHTNESVDEKLLCIMNVIKGINV